VLRWFFLVLVSCACVKLLSVEALGFNLRHFALLPSTVPQTPDSASRVPVELVRDQRCNIALPYGTVSAILSILVRIRQSVVYCWFSVEM
jgi:hypothetical protein